MSGEPGRRAGTPSETGVAAAAPRVVGGDSDTHPDTQHPLPVPLPLPLPFAEYLRLIERQARELWRDAAEAGMGRPVPSCPDWTVADLVGHQGTVHRWAAGNLRGGWDTDQDGLLAAARPPAVQELPEWYGSGVEDLLVALTDAPEDLRARRFLSNAADARSFWARRQTHETTMHRVDARAARLGRLPTAAESKIPLHVAADGIDELIMGFLPRARTRLHSAHPFTIVIAPTDCLNTWSVLLSSNQPECRRRADPCAEVVLAGPASAVYLGLWNRGDEIAQTGPVDALELWREQMRVTWH